MSLLRANPTLFDEIEDSLFGETEEVCYFGNGQLISRRARQENSGRSKALCRASGPRLRFSRKLLAPSASLPGPPTELVYRSGSDSRHNPLTDTLYHRY